MCSPARSVLLVDDDEDVRESLALVLRDEGYNVEVAGDGSEALAKLDEVPRPAVMLLDLMMPVMNGWQTLEVLQERQETMPVLVLSAAVPPKPKGAADYLRKPFDIEVLLDRVEKAFAA